MRCCNIQLFLTFICVIFIKWYIYVRKEIYECTLYYMI